MDYAPPGIMSLIASTSIPCHHTVFAVWKSRLRTPGTGQIVETNIAAPFVFSLCERRIGQELRAEPYSEALAEKWQGVESISFPGDSKRTSDRHSKGMRIVTVVPSPISLRTFS